MTPTATSNTEPTPRSACATVDLPAVRHNLGVARRHAPRSRMMAVIKSLAYGHGMPELARALEPEVDALAVARLDEAVTLREAGITAPLTVLEGVMHPDELALARCHRLHPVVHDLHQLALLRGDMSRDSLQCWVKFDTGMHRLGFDPSQADWVMRQLMALPHLELLGLMTHLANADDTSDDTTPRQLQRMAEIIPDSGLPRSIANSAGILAWPESHADWARPGLMLYGASPLIGRPAAELGLRPAMTLSAPLIAIRPTRKGDPVGYGGSWRAPEDLPLGVVAIGYGDGYPRHLGEGAQVLLKGRRVPVVGRVSMDMITIDLRGIGDVRVGDRVVLWGEGLPVEEVAGWANTIPYTLFCGITARVVRQYRD